MRFVLDASVSLAWFLDHPVPAFALKVKQLLSSGSRGVVPGIWHLEMANGLAVSERRGKIAAGDVDSSVIAVQQMLGKVVENAYAEIPFQQVLIAARSLQLSAYDAMYLETARAEGLPLSTLDKGLRAAAAKAGVELLR